MKTYYLGWIRDVPDFRDVPFRSVFRLPPALPASVDLRGDCSPVEDQGKLGSCTAQALVGALEYLEIKAGVKFANLSRLYIYYNERVREENTWWDSGATLRTGIKVLRQYGVCKESLWPYDISTFTRLPSIEAYKEGRLHQVTTYQRLNALIEMKACLAMGLPFVFGFSVYEHVESEEVAKTGIIRLPEKGEQMLGGHAVMAVGYQENTRTVLFRNSWGAAWGQAGYGQMPYAYLESRELSDDFWCIQGTESNRYAAWKYVERKA